MKSPARYTDNKGTIEALIQNTGEELILEVDGTIFISRFMDDFTIENESLPSERYTLNDFNELTDCRLDFKLPLILITGEKEILTELEIQINLDNPNLSDKYNTYKTSAVLSISLNDKDLQTTDIQDFESGLVKIKEKLTPEYKLKCCFGCAYGDYSVAGQQFFGSMLCFRNIKQEYLNVQDKVQYMDVMEKNDRFVQETYLCPDFMIREKGTGYRG
ncbi:hypothetical protein MYP_2691 [Sporocytophaga myxococcoides]|uniref:Uncharacterized protein n=1 Tax=Sporocytophaga myxococcoides TaxID=153721 RepID=A0A098LG96_9BACT|nr:DUF6304 family protein [Sporocytophaga myxococcoides]GAL85462.1 hypothetical protein MYP_2691 [Sporocytophaga myxococcoides]